MGLSHGGGIFGEYCCGIRGSSIHPPRPEGSKSRWHQGIWGLIATKISDWRASKGNSTGTSRTVAVLKVSGQSHHWAVTNCEAKKYLIL